MMIGFFTAKECEMREVDMLGVILHFLTTNLTNLANLFCLG